VHETERRDCIAPDGVMPQHRLKRPEVAIAFVRLADSRMVKAIVSVGRRPKRAV
jgi:hypothetical protein